MRHTSQDRHGARRRHSSGLEATGGTNDPRQDIRHGVAVELSRRKSTNVRVFEPRIRARRACPDHLCKMVR